MRDDIGGNDWKDAPGSGKKVREEDSYAGLSCAVIQQAVEDTRLKKHWRYASHDDMVGYITALHWFLSGDFEEYVRDCQLELSGEVVKKIKKNALGSAGIVGSRKEGLKQLRGIARFCVEKYDERKRGKADYDKIRNRVGVVGTGDKVKSRRSYE